MLAKYVEANAAAYFSKVKLFVIENQMMRAMFRVQFGLEGLLTQYGRVVPIHPTTVKTYFGTRAGVSPPLVRQTRRRLTVGTPARSPTRATRTPPWTTSAPTSRAST